MIIAIANFAAGFALRIVEILVESALYLLIGFLTAGLLRGLVGAARTRRLFGTGRVAAPLRAWVAATTLLPVCALGVLPVLREFRRAGVPRHAVLTFALAAPMLNPISLIGGISYLGPYLIGLLLLGSMIVAVGAGIAIGPGAAAEVTAAPDEAIGDGPGRLAGALVLAARAATGSILLDVGIGLAGAGAMAASIAPAYLAESLFDGVAWPIVRMASVAPLTYVTPEKCMATLPEMIKFRQSAGAMFVLVALGVGLSLGHASWAIRAYRAKVAARWLGMVLALTIAVAVAVAGLHPGVGTANADNDHFDEFTNPFQGSDHLPNLASAFTRFARPVEPFRWATVAALAGLLAGGVWCRRTGRTGIPETGRTRAPRPASAWDRPVSPRVVGIAGAGLGLAVAGLGVYAYFPPPAEVFQDMNIIRADFFGELSSRTLAPARHHLDLWERQAGKLVVGSLVRFTPLDEEARRQTDALRAGLRSLRSALDAGRADQARALSFEIGRIQDRCRLAFHVSY